MKIALDYDGTYTADPALWDAFIASAKSRGHTVIIVSCRYDTPENREETLVPGCSAILCNGSAKRWFCEDRRGCKFDIWIDDLPQTILEGI